MGLDLKFKHISLVDEMMESLLLVNQLYPDIDAQSLKSSLVEMVDCNNYQMLAVFSNDEMVGVCGYWILKMLYCGRYMQISNFVTDEKYRGQGVGNAIIKYLENYAKELKCDKFVLDSNVLNQDPHSLFFKHGFYIRGLHFMKDL